MAVRKLKPVTPGQRHKVIGTFEDITASVPEKSAVVKTIEYDPNRSARIALLFYADGEKRYIIAPNGLQVGATLMSGAEAVPEVGNALPLANIPVGTVIHNIEMRPGQGAKSRPGCQTRPFGW